MLIDGYRKDEEWVVHSAIQGALLIRPPPPLRQKKKSQVKEQEAAEGDVNLTKLPNDPVNSNLLMTIYSVICHCDFATVACFLLLFMNIVKLMFLNLRFTTNGILTANITYT